MNEGGVGQFHQFVPPPKEKNKDRFVIYIHISTNPESLVKVGLVHCEIIGLNGGSSKNKDYK